MVANDRRKEHLESAVRDFQNAEKIELQPGNLFELDPAEVGLYDLVIGCEIVEHVAHTVDFLKQLKRFVAPGGHILLTTPNGSYFRNKLPTHAMIQDFNALESQQFKPDADGHLFLMTAQELTAIAHKAGLHPIEIDLMASPFITGHCGFSMINYRRLARLCYWFEAQSRRLPLWLREKICFSMSAILAQD